MLLTSGLRARIRMKMVRGLGGQAERVEPRGAYELSRRSAQRPNGTPSVCLRFRPEVDDLVAVAEYAPAKGSLPGGQCVAMPTDFRLTTSGTSRRNGSGERLQRQPLRLEGRHTHRVQGYGDQPRHEGG
jgi:hypothetical protein